MKSVFLRTPFLFLLCLILILPLSVGCAEQPVEQPSNDTFTVGDVTYVDTTSVTNYVKIVFRDFGTVLVQLSPTDAPITVANFQYLVGNGFYNGLTIHRVEPGFVIQGGDPKGDGTGGSPQTIKGEFSANGVVNNLSHKRGVLSMARRGDNMDSASSQFFVCLDTFKCTYSLDGSYAAFGWVLLGMDVIDRIAGVDIVSNGYTNSPVEPIVITSMSFMTPEVTESATESAGASESDPTSDSGSASDSAAE